jgi:hypothetical protein
MVPLRTEAEAVAIALEIGVFEVADAVRWADQQIEHSEVPEVVICDVAMAGSKYPQDVSFTLRQLPGECDRSLAIRLVLRYALEALEGAKRDPREIARTLFDLACANDLPESDLKHHAWVYWDAIDLSRDGYGDETEEQIAAHMISTLTDFLKGPDGIARN